MTTAPANLMAVRALLREHLKIAAASLGITGDAAHRGGYHCGKDRVVTRDYSVAESPRDKAGLTDAASALDVGLFKVRTPKGTFDLYHFNRWMERELLANAPDTRDIREMIYSRDGKTVRRVDRLGKRTSGDNSHLWHTHFSFFRDSTKANRDQTPLFRRYLTAIGLIEGNDMLDKAKDTPVIQAAVHSTQIGRTGVTFGQVLDALRMLPAQVQGLRAEVAAATGRDPVDEQAIVAGVLAGLDPATIAAAIPPGIAKQVADELAARLGQGQARE